MRQTPVISSALFEELRKKHTKALQVKAEHLQNKSKEESSRRLELLRKNPVALKQSKKIIAWAKRVLQNKDLIEILVATGARYFQIALVKFVFSEMYDRKGDIILGIDLEKKEIYLNMGVPGLHRMNITIDREEDLVTAIIHEDFYKGFESSLFELVDLAQRDIDKEEVWKCVFKRLDPESIKQHLA